MPVDATRRLDKFRNPMQLTEFPAPHRPGGLIERLAVLRTTDGVIRTLVSESRVSIGVRVAGRAAVWRDGAWSDLPRFTLTGVHCAARIVRTDAQGLLVLAHLHPAAAPALGLEASRVVDRSIDLAAVWPPDLLDTLIHQLADAPDDATRVARLEAAIAQRLDASRGPDPSVIDAVNRIRAEPGEIRIAALAQDLALSADTLERRFAACVGVSPKRFARAARLRAAVLRYGAGTTLTDLAIGAGYFDQSHFVREMRQATGVPPARLLPFDTWC